MSTTLLNGLFALAKVVLNKGISWISTLFVRRKEAQKRLGKIVNSISDLQVVQA